MADVNVYDIVTEKVLEQLENGSVPWSKPWTTATMPRSLATGKPYQGVNTFLLLATEFDSPWWMTWKQVQNRGGRILTEEGKRSTIIVYWNLRKVHDTDKATGEKITRILPLLKYFRVYNLQQTKGVELTDKEAESVKFDPLSEDETNSNAEAIIAGWKGGPRVRHDGKGQAYYRPATDSIHLPKRETFKGTSQYYSTRFHEMVHSTGHESRLNRHKGDSYFGSHDYGREELVAEMGSAFLSAEAGFFTETAENNAAYLRSWIKVLENDSHAVVVAAGAAQKAADLILGREKRQED